MTDDYNVEEEELNMAQAQRMVQKVIRRSKILRNMFCGLFYKHNSQQ